MNAFVETFAEQEDSPTMIRTTLYDLIEALHAEVQPGEEALIVPTVMHLLRSGRIAFLGPIEACECEASHA